MHLIILSALTLFLYFGGSCGSRSKPHNLNRSKLPWKHGLLEYYYDENHPFTDEEKETIQTAMREIEEQSCIRFKNVDNSSTSATQFTKDRSFCYLAKSETNSTMSRLALTSYCIKDYADMMHGLLHMAHGNFNRYGLSITQSLYIRHGNMWVSNMNSPPEKARGFSKLDLYKLNKLYNCIQNRGVQIPGPNQIVNFKYKPCTNVFSDAACKHVELYCHGVELLQNKYRTELTVDETMAIAQRRCAKSCHQCDRVPYKCTDLSGRCFDYRYGCRPNYRREQHVGTNLTPLKRLLDSCPQTCGICEDKTRNFCVDYDDIECPFGAALCQGDTYTGNTSAETKETANKETNSRIAYLKRDCPKSCNVCEAQNNV